jgi:hypothetical protein
MPSKFVDLSIFLENRVVSDSQPFTPRITYLYRPPGELRAPTQRARAS